MDRLIKIFSWLRYWFLSLIETDYERPLISDRYKQCAKDVGEKRLRDAIFNKKSGEDVTLISLDGKTRWTIKN